MQLRCSFKVFMFDGKFSEIKCWAAVLHRYPRYDITLMTICQTTTTLLKFAVLTMLGGVDQIWCGGAAADISTSHLYPI